MPMDCSLYPDNWNELALAIKTEANWCCTNCGRPCRQPGELPGAAIARIECSNHPRVAELWDVVEDAEPVARLGRFVLTVAHLDHVPGNCVGEASPLENLNNLKALCAPCHGTYDLKQMSRKRVLKAERNGQLRTDDILNDVQLALFRS